MIDRDTVETCYRVLLRRPPESEEVIADKLRWCPDLESLLRALIDSPEFQGPQSLSPIPAFYAAPAEIDVAVSPAQMKALFARLSGQWKAMGETQPFWSVLTREEYRTENLNDAALTELYAGGERHAGLVDLFAARNGRTINHGVCLELGCGVGRVTQHLAKRYEKVIAVDISDGNLAQCRAMIGHRGLTNVETVLLTSPEDIANLPAFDVFFSMIVLQHNPPPIQKYTLDTLLKKLRPGGAFCFQLQTFAPSYKFEIEQFLISPVDTMDMHSLPMHEVLDLLRRHRLDIWEVAADEFTGRFGSYTFFGGAPARPGILTRIFG